MLSRAPAQNTQIRTIWRRFRQVQTDVHNGGSVRGLPTAIDHALQPAPRDGYAALRFARLHDVRPGRPKAGVHVCGRRTHRRRLGAPHASHCGTCDRLAQRACGPGMAGNLCSVLRESIFWAGHQGTVIRHRMVMPVNAAECHKARPAPAATRPDGRRQRQAQPARYRGQARLHADGPARSAPEPGRAPQPSAAVSLTVTAAAGRRPRGPRLPAPTSVSSRGSSAVRGERAH